MRRWAIAALAAVGVAHMAADAHAIELRAPVVCAMGEDCFIQNYVDLDPGPDFTDYRCGGAGYDGHDGVDFAVRGAAEMRAGVTVVASADGVVRGVRDGEPDDGVHQPGRDCGNGVVLTHDDGWETQYCHLRRGSVAVRPGQRVAAGTPLGLIGRSGRADFPHVHLAVRKDGAAVDPFRGLAGGPDCAAGDAPLWSAATVATLDYAPAWVNRIGLAGERPDWAAIDAGAASAPSRSSPIVAYVEVRNLPTDWRLDLALRGPDDDVLAANATTAPRHRANRQLFAGRKAPAGGWPPGRYAALLTITDAAGATQRAERAITLGP
ncbi:MAG: M23 family metallopeptidase [Pseudomonadota bacterium]